MEARYIVKAPCAYMHSPHIRRRSECHTNAKAARNLVSLIHLTSSNFGRRQNALISLQLDINSSLPCLIHKLSMDPESNWLELLQE